MSANTLFDTNPASGSPFAADVPEKATFEGMSVLCDMDGNDLYEGYMVKVDGWTGWHEIVRIDPIKRLLVVEDQYGDQSTVSPMSVTVL